MKNPKRRLKEKASRKVRNKAHGKSRSKPGRELPGRPLPTGPFPVTFIVAMALLFLATSYCVAGVQKTTLGYEFTYEDPGAASVSLAGSFNNWSATANPMARVAWTITGGRQLGSR